MLSKYEGLEFNAYLVAMSGKGVAIKARNVPIERATEVEREWKGNKDYFICICLVGSARDLDLSEDIKEY